MKLILLLFSLLLSLPLVAHDGSGKPRRPAAAAKRPVSFRLPSLANAGRCSGGANCRACSNCNYCGHCAGGGGTCSVCADYSAPVRRPARPARSSSSSRAANYTAPAPPQTVLQVTGDYYVSATTLNLRAEPSAEAEVVRVLERNDTVTVDELTNAKWVKVTVSTADGDVSGYLSRAYLSESPTY